MDMQHGNAAWIRSMDRQHGHASRTCSIDMQIDMVMSQEQAIWKRRNYELAKLLGHSTQHFNSKKGRGIFIYKTCHCY
jgi:hypothetical protein